MTRWRRGFTILKFIGLLLFAVILLEACEPAKNSTTQSQHSTTAKQVPPNQSEVHLLNPRQLTFGGENAEAYFSFDGKSVIFQSTRNPFDCDQQFTMQIDGSEVAQVSSGLGRTTCGFFTPDGQRLIYASTHLGSPECPPAPDRSIGYVWPLYDTFDIFSADLDGSNVLQLTDTNGYDAEGTVSPDGRKIVFTSMRDGDLEIYTMNIDGSSQTRLTEQLGYDGGAFFSPDSQWIIYRAKHPSEAAEVGEYKRLIAENLVAPDELEIYIMRADGTEKRQISSHGGANWAPFFHPSGTKVIFASDMDNENPRVPNFELYLMNLDGGELERITFDDAFDGFPMFSPDGTKLIWASNRFSANPGETNVFIADWIN